MSFFNISRSEFAALLFFLLFFTISCEDDSIYAETVADYIFKEVEEYDEKYWDFTIKFIAEEGEGESPAGKSFKNFPVEVHYPIFLSDIKSHKTGVKPLDHQKIKIKYEKKWPMMFGKLEKIKGRDEQGHTVEMDL